VSSSGRNSAAPIVVSLTFDDGYSDQWRVRSLLREYSLCATFYVNTRKIAQPGFMDWEQLAALAEDRHEIGGHTLDHINLESVDAAEARRQVDEDRRALIEKGFTATTFSYPFGASNPRIETIVRECGYVAARRAWGLRPIRDAGLSGRNKRPPAETIPLKSAWAIRSLGRNGPHHTLSEITDAILRAGSVRNAWVPLVFHHVSRRRVDDRYSIETKMLHQVRDRLAGRARAEIVVRTTDEVAREPAPAPAHCLVAPTEHVQEAQRLPNVPDRPELAPLPPQPSATRTSGGPH
jgi:Polysaccharide deacetylase